ncbi:hypothetical protein ACFU8W_52345, partial [Streptomyces sp. NPDC057565]
SASPHPPRVDPLPLGRTPREAPLNTAYPRTLLAWADEKATGLICWRCGYVHLFVNRDIQLYRADK